MFVTQEVPSPVSELNLQTYQRLKGLLQSGLRRQIFVLVCDDVNLQYHLAKQLNQDLKDESGSASCDANLVSLNLNLENPNFLLQIAQWLKNNSLISPLNFQILGIEGLTQQPSFIQQEFLNHLQTLERYLPKFQSNLLFWVSYPWFQNIQNSVPEFWRWHTGVFEFQGQPNPVPDSVNSLLDLNFTQISLDRDNTKIVPILPESLEISEQETGTDPEFLQKDSISTDDIPFVPPLENKEETFLPDESNPETIAEKLQRQYRDPLEQGEFSQENLATAIQAYEQSLQDPNQDEKETANIFNELGNFYWMLSRQTEIFDKILLNLEKAIQSYQQALETLSVEQNPALYTTLHNNLGAAYNDLSHYVDPAENLQHSINAYQEVLNLRQPDSDEQNCGHTQNNLGTAYWHLAQYQDSTNNLQKAIAAYNEALTQYNPQEDPLDWAMVQNNLGTAYWNLSQQEQNKNYLQDAIQCYRAALQYRTPQIAPDACAATQNNLGTTYWHLAEQCTENIHQQQEYLQKAVTAYEISIAIAQQLTIQDSSVYLNFDFFATHNNLGIVHYKLAQESPLYLDSKVKNKHLESSLKAHVKALQGMKPETDNYQITFNYLIQVIQTLYQEAGVNGQSRALSLIPGELVPQVLPRL